MKKVTLKKEYHVEELKANFLKKEVILNHAWELFCHLEDVEDKKLLEAVYACVHEYEFDIEELPPGLQDDVEEMYRESIKYYYYSGQ